MIAVDLIRAALVLTVPLLATRSLPAVYLLAFLIATAGVFFDPAKLSILPEIVPPGRLLRANSLMSTAENLTEILGWAFAGLLLAAVSTSVAFGLDALTFVASAGALALMRYRAPAREAAERSFRVLSGELRAGLRFLFRDRGVRANTIMIVVCVAGLGAAYPLTFLFAVRVLGGGARRLRRPGGGGRRRLPRRLARAGRPRLARAQGTRDDRRPRGHGRMPRAGRGHQLALGRRGAAGAVRPRQRGSAHRRGHVPAAGDPRGPARPRARLAVHAHAGHLRDSLCSWAGRSPDSSTCASSSSWPASSWRSRRSWDCSPGRSATPETVAARPCRVIAFGAASAATAGVESDV